MSTAVATQDKAALGAKVGLSAVGAVVVAVGAAGGVLAAVVVALALLGTPLFAIMGGASELAWLFHRDATFHHLRYIAPTVLDERFSDSPILVTIPLFTFVGYVMAESKTPDRIVRASSAFFGWMPGGLGDRVHRRERVLHDAHRRHRASQSSPSAASSIRRSASRATRTRSRSAS